MTENDSLQSLPQPVINLSESTKERLKVSIQSRCTELPNIELSKPPLYELSAEEIKRIETRRAKSREASRRCRERKRNKIAHLSNLCKELEVKRDELLSELNMLEREQETLLITLAYFGVRC